MKPISAIEAYENGDWKPMKDHRWLMYLAMAKEQHVNYEYLESMEQLSQNRLIAYVKKTLKILEGHHLDARIHDYVEKVLIWSEVAKGGSSRHREQWEEEGINLYAHNEGSAMIYAKEIEKGSDTKDTRDSDGLKHSVVETLIRTHGLLGQYIRGEVPLSHSRCIISLVGEEFETIDLMHMLSVLNHCIIAGVNEALWSRIEGDIQIAIQALIEDELKEYSLTAKERLKRLRAQSALRGENYEASYDKAARDLEELNQSLETMLYAWMGDREIWYFEAALQDFTFEEVMKLILMIQPQNLPQIVKHISYEEVMKVMYYDYQGEKRVNLYKKRMIEKYLSELSYEDILLGKRGNQTHLSISVSMHPNIEDTVFVAFVFTKPAINLINFCVEAERAELGYERAIVLLYDYFDLRKDKYDRFHNEEAYLATMNQSIDYKEVILQYIVGKKVMDIGPGGGALMDLIESKYPHMDVLGVDISSNVIEALERKKHQEHRKWTVSYGDALNLSKDFEEGSVDTIIFCSIIHELYSYIETEGQMFCKETIRKALVSAYKILPVGGRIIIRDGIMTEPKGQKRTIEFSSTEGMNFLERYAKDFKGRDIQYELNGHLRVSMPVNDAMEFLYTYTWGEESYAHEINEQFGYFTPEEYKAFIHESLGDSAMIKECQHYLQEGYTTALEPKVRIYDENGGRCRLPDSTCLIVIEKNSRICS